MRSKNCLFSERFDDLEILGSSEEGMRPKAAPLKSEKRLVLGLLKLILNKKNKNEENLVDFD